LSVQLVRVKCGDETGGRFAERVGNDEISLSGFGIDATGNTVALPPFSVYAHFDDGEVKEYSPPQTILTLGVPNAGTFPKTCVVSFILAEIDSGGLSEVAEKAVAKVTEQLTFRKQLMGGGANFLDIDWGAVWGEVRPILYGYVKDLIALGFADDIFPPQDVSVVIASPDFHWGDGTKLSPEETVEFRGHDGVYYLTYYWEIQTVA